MNNVDCLSVQKLLDFCNPFSGICWDIKEISFSDVEKAIANSKSESAPFSSGKSSKIWSRNKHIERIAYLVVNYNNEPINIDVGIPSLGYGIEWPVIDGNHRLAAAIFRGEKSIAAYCSGELDLIQQLKN
jgi:hypothetical protein